MQEAGRQRAVPNYNLVLAMQVTIPLVAVHAVQSPNADCTDHVQPLFQFFLSEMQFTVAAENSLHDIR